MAARRRLPEGHPRIGSGALGLLGRLKTLPPKPVKVLWYEDAKNPRGSECGARYYHGFIGIEKKVVKDIMAWIKAPRP